MKIRYRPGELWAAIAALIIVLAAVFVPAPRIIAGEDELAVKRLPQARSEALQNKQRYREARADYQKYIRTHDLSALLNTARGAIAEAKANPDDLQKLLNVRDVAAQIADYTPHLQRYGEASEPYLDSLRRYDSELMAWTRSLGAASEQLRDETWPIVENLKRNPVPIGEMLGYPIVKAAVVATQTATLLAHVAALDPNPNPHGAADKAAILDAINADVTAIWDSGRSIEYLAGLHNEYMSTLQTYDGKVEALANSLATGGQTGGRQLLAGGLNFLLAATVFAGLWALFKPRWEVAG